MPKKVLRILIHDVIVGDRIYSEFPGGSKKAYLQVIKRLDLGSGGIYLGVEYDEKREPIWIKVKKDIKAVIVRNE